MACTSSEKEESPKKTAFPLKIEEVGQRYLALERFSGTILVGKNDSVLFEKSYGMADYKQQTAFAPATAFKAGSLTVNVIHFMIEKMAANALIQLDEKVATYLPNLQGDYTINDLLQDQTGLPTIEEMKDNHPDMEYETIAFANKAIIDRENSKPSDLGDHLLGKVIERQHGNLDQALEIYLGDLGLENTYFVKENAAEAMGYLVKYQPEKTTVYPSPSYLYEEAYSHHGLKTTARDLLKMSKVVFKEARNLHGYLADDGFSYTLLKEKEKQQTIIVLSNRRHPVSDEIATSIQAILAETTYQLPLLRAPVKIDPAMLSTYTGWYAINPTIKFEVITENDSLFVMMGPNKVAILPQSNHQFYMLGNDAAMRFLHDSIGKVNRVELLNGFLKSDQFATKVE